MMCTCSFLVCTGGLFEGGFQVFFRYSRGVDSFRVYSWCFVPVLLAYQKFSDDEVLLPVFIVRFTTSNNVLR